jgi:Holliday junction resolvase RusA-like endonuclease
VPEAAGEVRLTLPMPPTTNKLYLRVRGGKLALTKEALAFRERVKNIVVSNLGMVNHLPTSPDDTYRVILDVYFDALENPGWFEMFDQDTFVSRGPNKGELIGRQGERKAKTRYKVVDVDNRIKFLQDCVCRCVGIPNDCQVFQVWLTKYEDQSNPRVEVTIKAVNNEQFFPNSVNKEVGNGS